MSFSFRLEKALRLTRVREKSKQVEIGASQRRLLILEQGIDGASEAMRKALSMRSVSMMPFETAKVAREREEIERLRAFVDEEKKKLSRAQAELVKLYSRRKALESLREKRRTEYRTEMARKGQKELDELYVRFRERER